MKIAICILLLEATLGGASLYDAYYGEGFIKFQQMMRPENIFIHSIFNKLDMVNSTNDKCIMHLKEYKESRYNETWAKYYQDSSGGLGPSMLSGSTINLGDFDECVAQRTPEFGSNYCWIKVELDNERPQRSSWVPNNTPLIFSICVPNSCSPALLEKLTSSFAEKHNFTASARCQSSRPELSPLDIVFLVLFSSIGLLTLSTMIPKEWIPINKQEFLDVWESYSIKRNLRSLSSGKEMLASLNAIRFLSQCLIIWYHMMITTLHVHYPVKNKFFFNQFFRSWIGTAEVELVLTVDTFFLMSGLLLTYNCLKRKTDFDLIKYYVHRYLRLTPAFAACVIILSTFANKFCSGPLCSVLIDAEHEACEKYWWTNLLYINNFYPGLLRSCMPHTWYLSVDWQLFMFVSPIIVIVINKWPQHIHKLVAGIFLSSIATAFIVSFVYEIPTDTLLFSSATIADNYYDKMYAVPHTRAGPWCIGMFLGILLHNHRNKPVTLPSWAVMTCWVGSAVVFFGSMEVNLPFLQGSINPKSFLNPLVIAGQRNLFALAVSWIIFATTANIAGPIGNFLSWKVFEPLGKLSYSTYLIHKLVVSLYASETRSPVYYSTATQVPPVLGLIVLSYAAGFLLYLTFEAPAFQLEKLLFRRRNTENGPPNNQLSHVTNIEDRHKGSGFSTNETQFKEL